MFTRLLASPGATDPSSVRVSSITTDAELTVAARLSADIFRLLAMLEVLMKGVANISSEDVFKRCLATKDDCTL